MKNENQTEASEAFDLIDFIAMLWKSWIVIAGIALVFSAVGVAVAFLLTPIYQAREVVQIREERSNSNALRSLAGSLGSLGELAGGALGGAEQDERSVALAVLKSRVIVEGFIQKNDLLPLLFPRAWDSSRRKWKTTSPEKTPNLEDGYKEFMETVFSVNEDKKTNLVSIVAEWKNPELAAAWVSGLVSDTNLMLKDRTIRESEANLEYLRNQATVTTIVPLQSALYSLMEVEYKKLMVARNVEDSVFRVVDPVQIPKRKVRPLRRLIVLAALGLGILTGIGYASLRYALDNRRRLRAGSSPVAR